MKEHESSKRNLQTSAIINSSTSNISGNHDLQISDEYIRKIFDNPYKLRKFKKNVFSSGDIRDTLTGNELTQTIEEAKFLYEDDWKNHASETDHIIPLKEIYDKNSHKTFLSDQDIKEAANIENNYSLKSKTTNSSKQDLTNTEMLKKLQQNGIEIDRDAERQLRREERRATVAVQQNIEYRRVQNIAKDAVTGAAEALEASTIPLSMDIIFNIIQVCEHKKDIKLAVTDVAKTIGVVAATGSATKLLNTALQNVDNPILQFALQHNLPAQIVSMVLLIKDDIKGIKNNTLSKEEGTSNILSKFAGIVGGKIGMVLGGKAIALLQYNPATQALGALLASYGGAALASIPIAIYASAVAKNLFDEVVGKGSWEAIKNSSIDCQTLAIVMKESVCGIKTNIAIFSYAINDANAVQNKINENFETFEQRKKPL